MNAKPRICVIGSSNTDLVVKCDQLPNPGQTVLGGEFSQHQGGKGANQAVAAARAGAEVIFIGAHGRDSFGRAAKDALDEEQVDTTHFIEVEGSNSGIALIFLGDNNSENMIAVAKSANDAVLKEMVESRSDLLATCDAILCQLETPVETVLAAARIAAQVEIPFILNPAPARKLDPELIRLSTVLVPNEEEVCLIAGTESPEQAATALYNLGCKAVVTTLGSAGALITDQSGQSRVMAIAVEAVDSVGAGDCFSAWLAVELSSGKSLEDAVAVANLAASMAVTKLGARSGMPYRRELKLNE